MYSLNNYEKALRSFGIQVEIICAMELAGKITPEEAYQKIKSELKEVKRVRKSDDKDMQ